MSEKFLPLALSRLEITEKGGSGREARVRQAFLGLKERFFAVKEYKQDDLVSLERLGGEILDDIAEFNSLGSTAIPNTSLIIANHPETGEPTLYAIQDWADKGTLKEKSYKEILDSKRLKVSLGRLLIQICEYFDLYGKMPDAIGASGLRIGGLRIPAIQNLFPFLSENIAISNEDEALFIDPHVNRKFSGLPYELRANLQYWSFKIFSSFLLRHTESRSIDPITVTEKRIKDFLIETPVQQIGPDDSDLEENEKFGKGRNILVVTESFGGTHGVSYSVRNCLRYLKLNGFNPVLFTSGSEDKTYDDSELGQINIIGGKRTPGGDREISLGIRKVNNLLSKKNYSAAIVFNPAFLGLQLLPLFKKNDIPIISTDETRIGKYLRYELPGKIGVLAQKVFEMQGIKVKKAISRYSEAIVVPSQSYGERLRKRGLDKVKVISKTANMSKEDFSIQGSKELKELIAPNGEKILIFVGKVSRVKNLDFLARVCNLLDRTTLQYKLLIVGHNENQKELNRIKGLFNRNNVFFVGNQHGKRLAQLYKVADLFVSPSASETLGLTTIEAQLFGLPAIVSDHIGSVDVVQNGVTGLNLPVEKQGDSKKWSEEIINILADDQKRERMSDAAKLQEYTSWKTHFRSMLQIVGI